MKKQYVKPAMEVLEVSTAELLAGSGDEFPGQHGRDNACAHGSHAWFCDDDD